MPSDPEPAKDIAAALDRLIAALRLDQDVRLASLLQYQLHRTAFSNLTERFSELRRLLRNAQSSAISNYSEKTGDQIENILTAIDRLV